MATSNQSATNLRQAGHGEQQNHPRVAESRSGSTPRTDQRAALPKGDEARMEQTATDARGNLCQSQPARIEEV